MISTRELGWVEQRAMNLATATLERMYILGYLAGKGYTLHSLRSMPMDKARRLRIEASLYASGRLAEIEQRARFVHELHGDYS